MFRLLGALGIIAGILLYAITGSELLVIEIGLVVFGLIMIVLHHVLGE